MKNKEKVVMKLNSQTIDTIVTQEQFEFLKKVLFRNKVSLCPTCVAKVCLADRKTLNGAVFEGISSANEVIVTDCPNYRKGH